MSNKPSGGFHFNSLDMHREAGGNSPHEYRRAEARVQEFVPESEWPEVYAMLFHPMRERLEIRRDADRMRREAE